MGNRRGARRGRAVIIGRRADWRERCEHVLGMAGFDTTISRGGLTGLVALEAGSIPKVVVIEQDACELGGLDFASFCRARPGYERLALLLVTAPERPASLEEARDRGVTALVEPDLAEGPMRWVIEQSLRRSSN